ncbi:hypothetical protein LIER_20781 [Lithospermum erythrorhizon]|uniref:INO80 complex subunit B-like conserved region domain-containing protein n=1 Tax=Lithospermum erythrorhizon TaxID=34254 RepID=A0AAV3QQQ4_LITER
MDAYSSYRFEGFDASVKRKRSQTLRRPRPKTQWGPGSDGDGDGNRKMYNLNQCISTSATRTKIVNGRSSVGHSNGVGGADPGQHEPSRQPRSAADGAGNENKLKKVKLKVGGVTHTIQTKSTSSGASAGGSSSKASQSSDTSRGRMRSVQGSLDRDNSSNKKGSLQSWKESSKGGGNHVKEDIGKMPAKGSTEKLADKSDLVRKSRRVPKKRVLDDSFDEEDDDEIRYLEKLKSSKVSVYYDEEPNKKQKSISRHGKQENLEGEDGKKYRSDQGSEDMEYEDEEELLSEGEPETKKQKKDFSDSPPEGKKEMNLTTRQRALLSGKDASSGSQADFFNGLPPPAPRKQKEKLTEVEQQLKRAEAAERRRLQNQKANEESQAEAIRKILGQDANRKKKEEQKKKRLELAQAASLTLAADTIRWAMGPTGTVVTFPQEMGLPQIFDTKPSNYPPPREKCAGPSCSNPYKYRDSKSQLPLCSLQCYKAIREIEQPET